LLFVIDVGNTNIVLGIYEKQNLIKSWRIISDRSKTADEYASLIYNLFQLSEINFGEVKGVIISSVVPVLTGVLEKMARQYFSVKPLVVCPDIKTGMPILYDNPHEVGADRIVNAVAGFEKFRRSLIIVDFGTATTFDYVNNKGEYCGGAIAPGLNVSMEALHLKASKLPKVEIVQPPSIIAKNTINSMQAGIYFGYIGLVDEIVGRMKSECKDNPYVVATGGLAGIIAPESRTIDSIEEFLTLEGLRILYLRNS